jgi:hypothetical protein
VSWMTKAAHVQVKLVTIGPVVKLIEKVVNVNVLSYAGFLFSR